MMTVASMQIRKMKKEDLPAIVSLAGQLGYPDELKNLSLRFHRVNKNEGSELFVAAVGEKIIGFIQINVEDISLLDNIRTDVAALIVDEAYRGQKVGKALLLRAEEWSREKGISVVRVRSNSKREDAKRFYLREGYSLSKVSNVFRKEI